MPNFLPNFIGLSCLEYFLNGTFRIVLSFESFFTFWLHLFEFHDQGISILKSLSDLGDMWLYEI